MSKTINFSVIPADKVLNQRIYTFIFGAILVCGGVKIAPAPIWDEAIIFLFAIFFIKSWEKPTYYSAIFACMIGFGVLGALNWNLSAIRVIVMSFGMFLFSTFKPIAFDIPIARKVASLYVGITICLPIIGLVFGFPIAWWQDFIWVGTAYAAYGLYVSGVLLVRFADSLFIRSLSLIFIFISGLLSDSRATLIVLSVLTMHAVVITESLKNKLRLILISICGFLLAFVILTCAKLSLMADPVGSLHNVATSVNVSDNGRRAQNLSVVHAAASSLSEIVIAHGSYAHQTELLRYVEADSSGIVRPTGIPAMVIDYGILFLAMVVCFYFLTFWNMYKKLMGLSYDEIYLGLELIIVSFLFLFVTNLVDSVIFWMVLSGSFIYSVVLARRAVICPANTQYWCSSSSI